MITEKSPVLFNRQDFLNWYEASGGMPVGESAVGDPTDYPCVAIGVSGEIPTSDGAHTEFVQFMDYVYYHEFQKARYTTV